jgi:hypothetical protein
MARFTGGRANGEDSEGERSRGGGRMSTSGTRALTYDQTESFAFARISFGVPYTETIVTKPWRYLFGDVVRNAQ